MRARARPRRDRAGRSRGRTRPARCACGRRAGRRTTRATGTPKPCFGRSISSSGITPRTAFLRMCFSVAAARLRPLAGSTSASSTNLWSRNGTRASRLDAHRHLVDAHQQQLGQAQVQVEVAHPVAGATAPRPSPRSGARIGASASHDVSPSSVARASAARAAAASAPRVNASAPPQNIGWPRAPRRRNSTSRRVPLPGRATRGARPRRFSTRGHRQVVAALRAAAASSRTGSPRTARRRPRRPGDDDAVVARELRHVVDRHADRVGDRLVLQPHHPRQEVEQVVVRQLAARGARRRRARPSARA